MTTRVSAVNVRRSLAAAAVVLAAPVLSSCGVNFDAQTDQVYNPAVGVDDQSGAVDVLNALVVSGTDGSGALVATLVNNERTEPDRLTKVAGAGEDQALQVTLAAPKEVKPGGLVNLAVEGPIPVRGERVVPGNFVEITFSFDRGAAVTLKAPVVSADNPAYADVKLPGAS